jgi:predicted nucleic acid-binding Zn ribbon protein
MEIPKMPEIAVYCPKCAERIKCKAVALSFDEIVTCGSCSAKVKATKLLTDEGKNLLDYLALQSVKASWKKPNV